MNTKHGPILVYSDARSSEEDRLCGLLSEIGYADIITINHQNCLNLLTPDNSYCALVLLLTEISPDQSGVLDILHLAKTIPVIGLFARIDSPRNQRIVVACHEVVVWPCSKQEFSYRLGIKTLS